MPDDLVVTRVRWTIDRAPDSLFLDVRGLDTYTQEFIRFRVPLHAVASLRNLLNEVIDAHPEAFARVQRHRDGS